MHPSPEAIRQVAERLERVNITCKPHLDMMRGTIDRYPCGTIACFGGFYALAKATEEQTEKWYGAAISYKGKVIIGSQQLSKSKIVSEPVSFVSGADMLAKDLGFSSRYGLELWAGKNPKLWGNKSGGRMFFSSDAFNSTHETITLTVIVEHWLMVADRIEALEKTQ